MPLIPLVQITRNPDQPRKDFPAGHIEGLAASIKRHGLLQSIIVRPTETGLYMIVAGECRYRAHQLLRAETIRAEIMPMADHDMGLRAIIENVQRLDMNPMEEARAFQRLLSIGMSVAEIVDQLGFKGKDRVQNRLNLLALSDDVQALVVTGALTTSMGSAIALAPQEHQSRIVRQINAGTLRTVDQVRHAGQALRDAADQIDAFAPAPPIATAEAAAVRALERRIEAVTRIVVDGFKNGQCVAAQRIAPDKVKTMADKLRLIRQSVLQMEHQLRCVAAQIDILKTEETRSENPKRPATVGMADRPRSQRPRKPNVADKLSRPRPDTRVRKGRSKG